jgi:hypothetical protein
LAVLSTKGPSNGQPFHDLVREQCSFRHRRSTPERMKNKVRAHATLLGLVLTRLKSVFRFPEQDIPRITTSVSDAEEIERAAEQCRLHWDIGLDGPIMEVGRVLERAGVVIVPAIGCAEGGCVFAVRADGNHRIESVCEEGRRIGILILAMNAAIWSCIRGSIRAASKRRSQPIGSRARFYFRAKQGR